jgi:hypothetical protein
MKYSTTQQMRTPLGVGSLVLLHDQACPKSSETYKLPALSATAMDDPFAAMQPVSTILVTTILVTDRTYRYNYSSEYRSFACGDRSVCHQDPSSPGSVRLSHAFPVLRELRFR